MAALASLAFAIFLVIVGWIVVGAALAGIGQTVSRLWRAKVDPAADHAPFWIGLASVVAFLQVWNCFAPISAWPLVIVLAVGLPAFLASRPISVERSAGWRGGWLIAFVLITFWLADRALAPANASDSGLYHLPAIRLASDFAIVPGVGNLMPAFAVGSGNFLYNAMLNVGPLSGRGWHVGNSLLFVAFLMRVWPAMARVVRGDGRPADGFDAALVPLCLFLLLGKDVSSPKTDLPAGALLLVMASQLARVLCGERPIHTLRGHVVTATVLGAAAVCMKISAAPMAALLWLGFVITWFRRDREDVAGLAMLAMPSLVIALLLPGVFVARNVVTSGYPLFPATVFPASVDWRLEPAAVEKYHRGFVEFTRFDLAQGLAKKVNATPLKFYGRLMDPGFSRLEDATATNWIRGWFFTMLVAWPIEVAVPIVIAMVLWLLGRRADQPARRARNMIALAAGMTLLAWFVTVPDGRYIWFATWALAGAAAIPAFHVLSRRTIVAGLLLACVAVVVFRVGLQLVYREGPIADVFVVRPGPDHGFHLPPTNAMTTFTSRHGFTLSYPANGSSTVWFSPQPATTVKYLDSDLKLRGKDFQAGVMIDRQR